MVTDQAPAEARPLLLELSDTQRRILAYCESPRTMAELLEHVGLSHRTHFRRQHLDPLLDAARSPVSKTGGYYRDEASVFRAELRRRASRPGSEESYLADAERREAELDNYLDSIE